MSEFKSPDGWVRTKLPPRKFYFRRRMNSVLIGFMLTLFPAEFVTALGWPWWAGVVGTGVGLPLTCRLIWRQWRVKFPIDHARIDQLERELGIGQ